MAIRITYIRLAGGSGHEHIVHLWWKDQGTNEPGNASRADVISWIEGKRGVAYVDDERGHVVSVGVVTPDRGPKYLRTYADAVWTDNLLSLPRK
jgi:Protein of unknown function (DUF3892)